MSLKPEVPMLEVMVAFSRDREKARVSIEWLVLDWMQMAIFAK
jgi:hypothetical protein